MVGTFLLFYRLLNWAPPTHTSRDDMTITYSHTPFHPSLFSSLLDFWLLLAHFVNHC